MKAFSFLLFASCTIIEAADIGPEAALRFAERYRGDEFVEDAQYCYPKAKGIPFSDTPGIIQMHASLWRPSEIIADFRRRMEGIESRSKKKGIIVVLKTERCASKPARLCSVTTAALEKQSTPLVSEFLI